MPLQLGVRGSAPELGRWDLGDMGTQTPWATRAVWGRSRQGSQ